MVIKEPLACLQALRPVRFLFDPTGVPEISFIIMVVIPGTFVIFYSLVAGTILNKRCSRL
jgi:hypothetical protein